MYYHSDYQTRYKYNKSNSRAYASTTTPEGHYHDY